MKYSFIIPMYNEALDISRTVDLCCRQIIEDYSMEIILVDDGSTDGTYDICKKQYENISYIKILKNKRNYGVSHARNYGVSHASGDVVIFLNADELIPNDFLKKIHNQHYIQNADYVFPQTEVENTNIGYGLFRNCYRRAKYPRTNMFMWSQGFSCKKSIFYHVGGFSELYPGCGGEDWDFVSNIDNIAKNRVVDLSIVVKHKVPETIRQILWHMYNRGRGSCYYHLNYSHKSPKRHIAKMLFWIILLIIDFAFGCKLTLGLIAYKFVIDIRDHINIVNKAEKNKGIVFMYSLLDKIIRFIGYNMTIVKNVWEQN